MLTVTGRASELTRQWAAALESCIVRHPNRGITPLLTLHDGPQPSLAFELVTVGDLRTRVLDPHATRATLDYVFHTGLPFTLTPESLLAALATAIPRGDAVQLVRESMEAP